MDGTGGDLAMLRRWSESSAGPAYERPVATGPGAVTAAWLVAATISLLLLLA